MRSVTPKRSTVMSCHKRLEGIHNYVLLSNPTTRNIACALQIFLSSAPVVILSPWQLQGCDITVDITGCYRTETKVFVPERPDLNGCTKRRKDNRGDSREPHTKPTLPERGEQRFKNHGTAQPRHTWHGSSKRFGGFRACRQLGGRGSNGEVRLSLLGEELQQLRDFMVRTGTRSWPENREIRAGCNHRMLYAGKMYI